MTLINTLSENAIARISQAVGATVKADKAMTSALDTLAADGIQSTDFISPKKTDSGSTASPELFNSINSAIVLGFAANVQTLLEKNTKSLTDPQKTTKRYWQQQIGARRNDFKRAMEKRENVGATDSGAQRTRTAEQRIRDNLNDIIKVCQNAEDVKFDIVKMIEFAKSGLKLV
jgi:hypothetical protein